jgi:hypothetical protein
VLKGRTLASLIGFSLESPNQEILKLISSFHQYRSIFLISACNEVQTICLSSIISTCMTREALGVVEFEFELN